MAQAALARVPRNPLVSAPIVGATKPHHIPQAADALGLRLTDGEAAASASVYVNAGASWF
jgi:aryl-alcohol dehydrogenase-like predicted oxidoreductase